MNNLEKARSYLALEEHENFKDEVRSLLTDEKKLSERFWKDLDFGTGGLRGLIGGGYNRMNPYVVRKATQGLANYIKAHIPEKQWSVAISFDSRNFSSLFAEETARVLAANSIKALLFKAPRPTPVLSFAVRTLGACAGVMVTASHNPAVYNGYKVFWSDGAQVVPPHDRGIIAEVRKVSGKVEALSKQTAEATGLIVPVGEDLDKTYKTMVLGQSLRPELIKERGGSFKVVYTPLHGVGAVPVEGVLNDLGIPVISVPQQREPDGDFPTVKFPNPETASAMKMAVELAKKHGADLVMATDPDADRLGIAVPEENRWTLITGNQLGALLADYIFRSSKEKKRLPDRPAFVNTIVTSEFQNRIADSYGIANFRVLTGFKYIGEKIRLFEADKSHTFVFGSEESYGYLIGSAVRDKDAVSTAAMTAEMALWNRSRGLTVMDHLKELWARHGYWEEFVSSKEFEGQQGQIAMETMMNLLRRIPPKRIGSRKVTELRDYQNGTTLHLEDGKREKNLDLPSSNVLQFTLEDGSLITARPSGTEPKIKFYASCRSDRGDDLNAARKDTGDVLKGVESWIEECIEASKK